MTHLAENFRIAENDDTILCTSESNIETPWVIQKANTVALSHKVTITSMLQMVKEARSKGLKAPVLLMGYYNPMYIYGEEKLMKDCVEAGTNGFIAVDVPPEEAVSFRELCVRYG